MQLSRIVLTLTATIILPIMSYAMPCDSGIQCVSKTGTYKLEATVCRYENEVRNISLSINDVAIDAKLLNYFDGRSDGQPLMIDIAIPNMPYDDEESVRKITVLVNPDINEKDWTSSGKIVSKFLESKPGPYKITQSESISCAIE